MKSIPLKSVDKITTREVIDSVCKTPVAGGVQLEDMRTRFKILDALEALPATATEFVVDDDTWKRIAALAKVCPFVIVNRGLLKILDDIINATEPKSNGEGAPPAKARTKAK